MRNPAGHWQQDDARNVNLYTRLANEHGFDARALNWGSRESQNLRFAVLAQVGRLDGASILDVGCGQGDFFFFLKTVEIHVDYTGIDITPKMVDMARQRFPEARFLQGSLPLLNSELAVKYDFIFASGIFYYRQHEPVEFLRSTIVSLFGLCRRAVAFNSLSSWAANKDPEEFCADPLLTVEWCRRLTPWVTLRHDYHRGDFTVYLYRDPFSQ